jgi:D-alanine-D-alanine ligase
MRITVLTHLRREEDEKSYEPVVDQVAAALRDNGHKAEVFGVRADIGKLVDGLRRQKPDLVFNLLETFGETELGFVGAVGLLDLLGVPYTGAGPGESYLQEDKGLTKKLLAFDGILYPDYAIFSIEAGLETGGNLRMPLFVKPLRMDASIGIDARSLVRDSKELMQRVAAIHKLNDSALAEEFIDGREFYVGVLGNSTPRAFPPIEMDFSGLPEGAPKVLGAKAKWDTRSVEYQGTRAVVADLPDELRAKVQKVAMEAYRALRVCEYGRVDLRMAETGEIYVIEVNANCYLEQDGEFAAGAKAAGLEYSELIQEIVDLAVERHRGRR